MSYEERYAAYQLDKLARREAQRELHQRLKQAEEEKHKPLFDDIFALAERRLQARTRQAPEVLARRFPNKRARLLPTRFEVVFSNEETREVEVFRISASDLP